MRHHETSAAPKCPLPPALATWSALAAGLGLYLVDKYEGLPPAVITGVLLLAAAVKTGYFLLHNFRALAALRETFQQFLLLVSLNLSMIAHSFALDFYCLYRINDLTFAGLRPGSELDIFGQLVYQSVGTLISNSGGTLSAAARTCCWRRLPVSFRRCSLFRTRPATSAPWQNSPPARRYCRPRRPKWPPSPSWPLHRSASIPNHAGFAAAARSHHLAPA